MADGPRLTALGKIFIFLFVAVCVSGAYYFFQNNGATSKGKASGGPGGMLDSLSGGGARHRSAGAP